MRKSAGTAAILIGIFLLASSGAVGAPKTKDVKRPLKAWAMIWSDEFDGQGSPDPEKWVIEQGGGGFGNDEQQHYTSQQKNLRQENGHLIIEGHKENFGDEHYTSGRMHSKLNLTYGRVEFRAKFAAGNGVWPALWLLANEPFYGDGLWPDNGEIDVAEYVGRDPGTILSCFYTKNANWMNGNGHNATTSVETAESEFHVYSLEWTPEYVAISVDGQEYNRFTNPHTNWMDWPFNRGFNIIVNMALGGYGGDVDDSIFPQKTLIDYVRVYQQL